MGTHLLNFNMGSSLSYDVPPKKDLKKLGKSKVSREDLIRMKDRLRRIARREHGISRESFEEVASSVGVAHSKFVANWFDQFDSDGEEWFDFKMFAVYAALTARVKRRTVVEFCFRAYDKDSSGSLALDELTTLMLAVGRVIKQTNYALPGSVGKGSPSCDSAQRRSAESQRPLLASSTSSTRTTTTKSPTGSLPQALTARKSAPSSTTFPPLQTLSPRQSTAPSPSPLASTSTSTTRVTRTKPPQRRRRTNQSQRRA